MNIPVVVLLVVFIAIAIRQASHVRLQIWQIMLAGALVVILTGQIAPGEALRAVNPDIMMFLFWMFLLGRALETSGYLGHLAYGLFNRAATADRLLFFIVFGCGLLSALLMNDTIAIVGTPVMLILARQHGIHTRPLLLALAFSVTTGSVMSPIGNPQNLLIALDALPSDAFTVFGRYLFIPTILSLTATFLTLKFLYREHFADQELVHEKTELKDPTMASVTKISLVILGMLTITKIVMTTMCSSREFPITWIAAGAGLPVLLFSPGRAKLLRTLDWPTLVFFAAMFVLMESVWLTGFFQHAFREAGIDLSDIRALLPVSILLSQFISNVPLVALCLPLLQEPSASVKLLMVLAAGSTIAGNLLISGAASNVIIVQNAETRGEHSIGFFEFAIPGLLLTTIQAVIYGIFLFLMP
jgi:Na+/H+ antiporter NhaD/arsenite permease-like protein